MYLLEGALDLRPGFFRVRAEVEREPQVALALLLLAQPMTKSFLDFAVRGLAEAHRHFRVQADKKAIDHIRLDRIAPFALELG